MTNLTGLLTHIFTVYDDGGMSVEEAVKTTEEALETAGYKKTKYKWEYDQEGDMHDENDSRN